MTGTYDETPLAKVNRSLTVEQIRGRNLLFTTAVDALRLNPSVDIRARGPHGTQVDLSLRGGTFGQTLVLLNGRRLNDAQSGHHNFNLPLPLEAIEQVEVLSGAGSTLYGADAVGGVVNLITKAGREGSRPELRLQSGLGNFGTNQQRGSLSGGWRNLSQQLSFSRDFSTGFTENRDFRNLSLFSGTQLKSRFGTTGLDLGLTDKPFGAQGFYGNFPSWERTKAWYAALRQSLGETTEAAFSYRRHTDVFVLRRFRPQDYMNHHTSQSWQASLRRRSSLGAHALLHYGAEAFGDHIVSNNLGNHDRARAAAYANLDLRPTSRLSLSAGLRDEVVRGLPGQLNPTLAAGFVLLPQVKLRASLSRAFRLPTFTDLFYRDPANVGNPSLRPERSWSYEGGLDVYPLAQLRASATVFHRRDRDVIDFARTPSDLIWRAENVQSLNFTGLETAFTYTFSNRLRGAVLDLRYTGLTASQDLLPGLQSRYAFNYLRHSAQFGFTGQLGRQVVFRTRLGAYSRRGGQDYPNLDLFLARSQGLWRPFLQLSNLTNAAWQDIPGVLNPPRGILGGVELLFRRK
ncbi:MAG: TonB-dependent receptor [Bryobacter sp.]|nr:TonB-dependent receptor [Bryobacter sp.]